MLPSSLSTQYTRQYPLALFPTAAQDRCSEGWVADAFLIDVREVRAMNLFTSELLISRAREGGYVPISWEPRSRVYSAILDELSRVILGHWSKLLTQTEREERRHVQFVLRVMRRQYYPERNLCHTA